MKGEEDMRSIVHSKEEAREDLKCECEEEKEAEVPGIVYVERGRVVDKVLRKQLKKRAFEEGFQGLEDWFESKEGRVRRRKRRERGMIRNDAPVRWGLGFQDPATPVMEGIISLHHEIMYVIISVMVMVTYILMRIIYNYDYRKNREVRKAKRGALIEAIWTLTPTVILIIIAVPSYALLYAMEEEVSPGVTVKIIGHQWYWSYEYSDYGEEGISYDSYMIGEEELEEGDLRLLEVDKRMVLPINTHVRLLLTSSDVIHSWAVPSLGVKCDAVPGRLSQVSVYIKREGVYYGQCSELCGMNHAYMPIVVEGVKLEGYKEWIKSKI